MELGDLAQRKIPLRRRRNGRDVRLKNAASAANARAQKVGIVTGAGSRAVWGELDRRFSFAKAVGTYANEYRTHAGSDRPVTVDDLCVAAARHKALANLAYTELMRGGLFASDGSLRPAYDAFRKADADLRAVLSLLGLERREQQVPSLHEVLNSEAGS